MMPDNFRRSDFAKTPAQIDAYIEAFIEQVNTRYPQLDAKKYMLGYLSRAEAARWMKDNSVPISTFMIAYFVNKDSKVTLDKIANYCVDANINPERFLYQAINEFVDKTYELTTLKIGIKELKAELERERQKRLPLWRRLLNHFLRKDR